MSFETGEVHKALETLEDYSLDNHLSRSYNYNVLLKVLERKVPLALKEAERLLAVCVHDLIEDKQHAATILDIIYMIVTQVKEKLIDPQPDLTPSLLTVIQMIKIIPPGNMENIKSLCFRTLLSYPDDTLLSAPIEDVLNIINLTINVTDINKTQPLYILNRILKILPADQTKKFVENGLDIWLSRVVPITMIHYQKASPDVENVLETLEILTEHIVELDYAMNRHLQSILLSICNSNGYSYLMRKRLSEGCEMWQRVWIVFIKLLKYQITQPLLNIGTPINCMLPVVEEAFKLDVPNRCRAFQCWKVLIDSFSLEENERNISKRLKLLIIPLKSNNAKAEETVLVKLDCWWRLLWRFRNKMEKYLDLILDPFLIFCFGKPQCTDRSVLIPGRISIKTQKICMEAMVEIFEHIHDCRGCTSLQRLSAALVTTKYLVDNWKYWIHALTTTIELSAESEYGLSNTQLLCLWRSFLLTVVKLTDDNLRKKLLNEVISIVDGMLKGCGSNNRVANVVMNVLLLPLFEADSRIIPFLESNTGENDPLYKILKIVIHPKLDVMYQRCNTHELIKKIKYLTNFVTNTQYSSPNSVIDWIWANLPERNCGLILLTSLAESISETQCALDPIIVKKMLMWLLKTINSFTSVTVGDYVQISARTWNKLYGALMPNIPDVNKADIDKAISELLFMPDEDNSSMCQSSVYYKLCVVSAVLKYKVTTTSCNEYKKELELFKNLTNNIDSYSSYGLLFPALIDDAVAILAGIKPGVTSETTVKNILISIKNMIKVLDSECSKSSQELLVWKLNENLCKSLKTIFLESSYEELISDIFVDFVEHSSSLMQYTPIRDIILKVRLKNMDVIEVPSKRTKTLLEENNPVTTENSEDNENIHKLPPPDIKNVPKKTKKKQGRFVYSDVENGEEYLVVKSNWKFNPRKLTENQKEKLQRKREDIPALYQDLSQSQDEYKLVTWKTDSQDTSTSSKSESTSSKTNKDETASDIIKQIPSSNVVPKIMENLLSKNESKETTNNAKHLETPSRKSTTSPRMALKDRVFKNVRTLIERSGVQKENKNVSEDINKTLNIPKTPTQTKPNHIDNIVNSAPPMLSADRPSRVRRKPRKFEDTELLSFKRTRRASHDMQLGSKVYDQNTVKLSQHEDFNAINEDKISSVVVEIHKEEKSNENKNTDFCANAVTDKESIEKPLEKEKSLCVVVEPIKIYNMVEPENEVVKKMKGEEINKMEIKIERVPEICMGTNNPVITGEKGQANKIDLTSASTNNDLKDESTNRKESYCARLESHGDKISKRALTPEDESKQMDVKSHSAGKKTKVRKSRIEKELAIDMVEGHPLFKLQSEKRLTRKALETNTTSRRKILVQKLNKSKSEVVDSGTNEDKNLKEKNKSTSITVDESQDKYSETKENSSVSEDFLLSDDVIESSQDSTATTISVKSTKKLPKVPVVSIEKVPMDNLENLVTSQSILDCVANASKQPSNKEDKDDTLLPLNKTVGAEVFPDDLTENMDTEPINDQQMSDVYIVLDDATDPITVSDDTVVGPETQELAEADTLPTDPKDFMDKTSNISVIDVLSKSDKMKSNTAINCQTCGEKSTSPTDATVTLSESACAEIEKSEGVSSPLKDKVERKQDFLNNTLEISPIKTMSPDRSKKSPSPETSSDYVVIKLSSPVHSNGEPYDKCGSPEVFTEDKTSPDKRDQSPPRAEVTVTNTSPSSSLSLKKNRPQMRSGGRGAQMLGLCVPDKVQDIVHIDKYEPEEAKRSNTPARRNLKIMYNSVGDNTETTNESEDSENFLKFRRSLPAVNSSPSNPILKRKLAEITDDAMISPASKRKRVSFHDPPVSTTVSVQKYIEPAGVRSPQNSSQKRLERQMRQFTPVKSPKRLSNVFKLDNVLTKTVESFSDAADSTTDYTQSISLDETPVVEIVRASELNDTDPICPELVDCKDDIINIASELSSFAMKTLLVKALKSKVETVGDLAKMTELEVNRLCIKAPKVKVAKKVLTDYASKRLEIEGNEAITVTEIEVDEAAFDEPVLEPELKVVDMEIQTDKQEYCEMEVQTIPTLTVMKYSQTEVAASRNMTAQTDQTGSMSTADVIKTCLTERPDFVEELKEHLEESSVLEIADRLLSFGSKTDLLLKQISCCNSKRLLNKIIGQQSTAASKEHSKNLEMQYIREFICDKFEAKDLILFCRDVLNCVYNKPA